MLLTSELQRIKHEVGINQLTLGAIPYVEITQYFEQIVLPNLQAGALTTSTTVVAASPTPAPATLLLASSTGFAMFARVVIDVDENQETAQVQSVFGPQITLYLSLAHAGTYPVEVESGETIVRSYLRKLRTLEFQIEKVPSRAGVKKVDEIELETKRDGTSQLATLLATQTQWRRELCKLLFGVGDVMDLAGGGGGGGSRMAIY